MAVRHGLHHLMDLVLNSERREPQERIGVCWPPRVTLVSRVLPGRGTRTATRARSQISLLMTWVTLSSPMDLLGLQQLAVSHLEPQGLLAIQIGTC